MYIFVSSFPNSWKKKKKKVWDTPWITYIQVGKSFLSARTSAKKTWRLNGLLARHKKALRFERAGRKETAQKKDTPRETKTKRERQFQSWKSPDNSYKGASWEWCYASSWSSDVNYFLHAPVWPGARIRVLLHIAKTSRAPYLTGAQTGSAGNQMGSKILV